MLMMPVLSTALNVVVVAAFIIAAARLLPRILGLGSDASRPTFGTTPFVAVLVATALAAAVSHVVGGFVSEGLVAFLIPQGAHAMFASRDAGEQLAYEGAFVVFALHVAPLAVIAITRAFTLRRGVIARFAISACVGSAALSGGLLPLMPPAWERAMTMEAKGIGDAPLIDVVTSIADAVELLIVFAIVGVIAGVAFTLVATGPALRARDAIERRALLIALCLSAPAALLLGGLASPAPDVLSQMLLAVTIALAWLVAVGLGLAAGAVARRRRN